MTIANNAPVSTNQSTAASVAPAVRSELPCVLRWRQNKLWVSSVVRGKDYPLPALGRPEWFRACLSKSKAELVCIDPALGTEVISLWAAAC